MIKELQLSNGEKMELQRLYETEVLPYFLANFDKDDEENHWHGQQVGDRMFDFCLCWDEGEIISIVYECDEIIDHDGSMNWTTNTRAEWRIGENQIKEEEVWNFVGGDGLKSYELVEIIYKLVAGHVDLNTLRDQIVEFNRGEDDE
jgi:hypothetical protein